MDELFSRSRKIVIERHQIPKDFLREHPGKLSTNTVKRLYSNNPSDWRRLSAKSKNLVINIANENFDVSLYNYLKLSINISNTDEKNASRYIGLYRYYRMNSQNILVNGGVRVFKEETMLMFHHFNDFDKSENKSSPDHRGFVFTSNGKIFFVGIGKGYFRPIIGLDVVNLSEKYLRVLVTFFDRNGALISASSVMVHESNLRFNEEFNKDALEENFMSTSTTIPGILFV